MEEALCSDGLPAELRILLHSIPYSSEESCFGGGSDMSGVWICRIMYICETGLSKYYGLDRKRSSANEWLSNGKGRLLHTRKVVREKGTRVISHMFPTEQQRAAFRQPDNMQVAGNGF